MPASRVHETQCGQTIEPGVSHTLDDPSPVSLRELPQRRHLGSKSREIIRRLGGDGKVELARDRLHELFADSRSKSLERRGVHEKWNYSRF